jgi:hypothetical protein
MGRVQGRLGRWAATSDVVIVDFVILHAPELGAGGHVHHVELDQFIGPRYEELSRRFETSKLV